MSGSRIPAFPAAPEGSLERIAAISAKAYLEAAKVEEQKSIVLGKVPKEIRDKIDALHNSADKISSKFYGIVKPLLKNLSDVVQQQTGIIKSIQSLWVAHHANKPDLVKNIYDTICTNRTALTEATKKFVITNTSKAIPELEHRLKLLDTEHKKIDQTTAKAAYDLYVKRYNTLKDEIESCKRYQAEVTSWIELERNKSAEMSAKIKDLNWACDGNQPNSAPEESKEQAAPPRPASPAPSTDSDSDNSPSNSANHSPKDEKDSPPFNPNSGKDVKTFSLPQPVFGSNSDAIKKQNQQSAAAQQYQMPPAYNPASLSNGK